MSSPAVEPLKTKILVVADDALVARDLSQQLADYGSEPLGPATSGEAALALAEHLRPDLVVIDVPLAGAQHGLTTARALRQRLRRPVVLLAARSDRADLERAQGAEPFDWLLKPCDAQALRTAIELALFRHRAEARQRAQEARYRALADAADAAIVTTDRAGHMVDWNRGATRIFGYAEAEALGRPLSRLLPSLAQPEPAAELARVQAGGAEPAPDRTVELTGRHRDGREFPVELSLAAWTTAEGPFVTAIIRDLSARKRTEESMRLRSAALAAAVNSVVITDAQGTIQWVNPAFCQITGYTPEEAVGQNARVLKSGHQPHDDYAAMWRTVSAGQSWRGEFVNRRKDGTLYTADVTITPVRDETGAINHYIAIQQDNSALKDSHTALHTAHTELAAKNAALQAALVDARTAGDAKAAFLATMSHEIRTPMNGVLGITSLLRETAPLTTEQADYIETIRSSGDTLLALINDVLDFSKIDSAHLELEQVPFDLRRCVEETLEALAPRAQQKHLDLAALIDEAVPATVVGDAVRLRQILTNLVGNALKFTERGEVVVEIGATPAPAGRTRLGLSVRDTGIGIPPDKIGRLFQAFTQVDASTTRIYGGTGLGLVISQRLVELMGSTITVASAPGVGTTFAFEWTVATAPALTPPDPARNLLALAGRSVLIVDDNATNRHIFVTQLRKAGLVPTEVASGAAGLEWLRTHPWPDLIITDMLMPHMDGLDFTLAVRALEAGRGEQPPLPVVLISSGGYRSGDPRAKVAGLAAALSKPTRRQQLIDTVAGVCALAPASPRRREPAIAPHDELRTLAQQRPCRILLAEDNPVNRTVALGMLTRLGYAATVAVNGLAAVEACRTQPFDLVLMDVQMPELDGLEATRRLRQLPGPPPTIFAMTANAMQGDREACLAAGMDDYIAKPIRFADLQRAITAARGRPPRG